MIHFFQRSVRRFTRTRWNYVSGILLLAVALMGGCQKQSVSAPPPDTSQVIVIPGLGISNRYEVGMTFSKIKNSFPDAISRRSAWGKYSTAMLVPSLGAGSFLGEDKPVSHINFHIETYKAEMYPDLEIRTPFRGRLGDEFNFGEKIVSGQDVEAVYGPVLKRVLAGGEGLKFLQQADPFSHILPHVPDCQNVFRIDRGVRLFVALDPIRFQYMRRQKICEDLHIDLSGFGPAHADCLRCCADMATECEKHTT